MQQLNAVFYLFFGIGMENCITQEEIIQSQISFISFSRPRTTAPVCRTLSIIKSKEEL